MDALEQFGNSYRRPLEVTPNKRLWSRFVASWKQAISPNISWWVPYWSHTWLVWRVFRLMFALSSVLRVTILSLLITAAIIAWVQATIPGVQLPLWKMLLCVPAMYAYMAIMLLLHLVFPTNIKVRKDRIHATTGQSNWVVKGKDVYRTRIVVFAVNRIRLHIFYTRKNRRCSRTFGVSPKINLDALCANLPVYPQVWDARHRFQTKKCAVASGPASNGLVDPRPR